MTPHTLYLVRHGQTEDNLAERLTGQCDSPLTPLGVEQASANGHLLAELVDCGVCDFVASPLGRARRTMELLRGAVGLPHADYRTDERLMEGDFGTWHGKPWLESKAFWKELRAQQGDDGWHTPWPGGESRAQFFDRVSRFLETLTRKTVIVSHGGTVRMMRGALLKLSNGDMLRFEPLNTGIIEICAGREQLHGH